MRKKENKNKDNKCEKNSKGNKNENRRRKVIQVIESRQFIKVKKVETAREN